MLATIYPGIVAFLKAVPAARDIFEGVVAQYYAIGQSSDDSNMNEIQKEREAIVAAISQPGLTDEQVRTFRKRLIALHSN